VSMFRAAIFFRHLMQFNLDSSQVGL
jgi:hypothetical protein